MPPDKSLFFKDRDAWRGWLKSNHEVSDGVWLYHFKKASGRTGLTHEEGIEEALCFGWIDSKLVKVDEEKYALRYTPRKPGSVWSKINKEKAEALIMQGKMTEAGFLKIAEAKEAGLWQKAYTNIDKDEIPKDLESALKKSAVAWKNFNRFANSYRNMYIGWVVSAKISATRKSRIDLVVLQALEKKKLLFPNNSDFEA
jgi:uncharacterized protein YdeI (YjbR/CyaY-like superfamily)